MSVLNKFDELSALMSFEADIELTPLGGSVTAHSTSKAPPCEFYHINQAQLPNGRRITLLKTLLNSACERNCYYCPFRAGRDFRRVSMQPEEFSEAFMALYRAGIVQGVFLSSGISGGSIRTQDALIAAAEILRFKHKFNGYLHLKLMPGAEYAQVERALQLADRVSLNLEAPNAQRLPLLAPRKNFDELINPLKWVDRIRQHQSPQRSWKGHWPSMTTQFVVGAAGESDQELLSTTDSLHKSLHLTRAFFQAFHPVEGTPFENLPAVSQVRQNRLYQASFLLRDYQFKLEELLFTVSGDLPLQTDPKTAWAEIHLKDNPIEINLASRHDLLRIPGIGIKGAGAILRARRQGTLRFLEDLNKIGVHPSRAAPYILLDGKRPVLQASFW